MSDDSHPSFFSSEKKAYDIISNFLNNVDRWVEEVGDRELERIAANLKRSTIPGFEPSDEEMNDELRYIQWRDEILKPWNDYKNQEGYHGNTVPE